MYISHILLWLWLIKARAFPCKLLPGVCQVDRQQLAAGHPEWGVALGVIDDLQEELAVVIVNLLCSQGAVIIHRQQVPAIDLQPHQLHLLIRVPVDPELCFTMKASFRKSKCNILCYGQFPPTSLWTLYSAVNSSRILFVTSWWYQRPFHVTMEVHYLLNSIWWKWILPV